MATRALGPSSSLTGKDFNERQILNNSELRDVPPKPGLRLLAFDDGGARGLSMLLFLRNMLREVGYISHEPGLPCEYFDIIAGSGTGGLIALLLGRLRLSMDDAIECYTRVVDRVFMSTKGGKFKDASLEEVLKEICKRFAGAEDAKMFGDRIRNCKTFVCVRERDPSGALLPQKLRTYSHPAERSIQCTIVDAVRATMGNPAFFTPPILSTGNNASSTFMDAGDNRYNPSFDLYEEALSLSPSREVAYFLSLGAGRPSTIDLTPPRGIMHQPRLPPSCMAAMHHLATRCDALAESFLRENDELEPVYYRFNHDQGSLDGKMAQWEQVGVLKEFLKPYSLSVDNVTWALEAKMMDQREYELAFRRGT